MAANVREHHLKPGVVIAKPDVVLAIAAGEDRRRQILHRAAGLKASVVLESPKQRDQRLEHLTFGEDVAGAGASGWSFINSVKGHPAKQASVEIRKGFEEGGDKAVRRADGIVGGRRAGALDPRQTVLNPPTEEFGQNVELRGEEIVQGRRTDVRAGGDRVHGRDVKPALSEEAVTAGQDELTPLEAFSFSQSRHGWLLRRPPGSHPGSARLLG